MCSKPKQRHQGLQKGFIHKAAEQGDGKASLRSSFLKVRGLSYLWDTEAGGLRHGVRPLETQKR